METCRPGVPLMVIFMCDLVIETEFPRSFAGSAPPAFEVALLLALALRLDLISEVGINFKFKLK